jgi:hypothetical protein
MDINEAKRILSTDNINHFCELIDDITYALDTLVKDPDAYTDLVSVEWAAAMARMDYLVEDEVDAIHTYFKEAEAVLPGFEEKLEEHYNEE